MALDPRDLLRSRTTTIKEPEAPAPLGGTRAQRIQRLQIGLLGIGGMVLMLGLADAISSRAQRTEEAAVPEAAPTVAPSEAIGQGDPLSEAGVLPELPATPAPTTTGAPTGEGDRAETPLNNAPLQ